MFSGNAIKCLNIGAFRAEAFASPYIPEEMIWITLTNNKLMLVSGPKDYHKAQLIADENNLIYNTPLAKVLREEE